MGFEDGMYSSTDPFAIILLNFKNSIWLLIPRKIFIYDMLTMDLTVISSQKKYKLHYSFVLFFSEIEAKQAAELQMRNLQMELRSANNAIKQVSYYLPLFI